MPSALLLSGGLDSACAWWVIGKPPWFYFPGGRPADEGESRAVRKLAVLNADFRIRGSTIQHDWTPFQRPGVWSWNRERLMAVMLWARGYDEVMAAWHRDDIEEVEAGTNWRPPKLRILDTDHFRFTFPVGHLRRRELVRAALDAGAPDKFLLATHSCLILSEPHCGLCANCIKRKEALLGCGINDSTEYLAREEMDANPGYGGRHDSGQRGLEGGG